MIQVLLSIFLVTNANVEKLFQKASKWRVREAISEADSARKELVKLGDVSLEYIFTKKIKTTSTLEYRAIRYVVKHLREKSRPYIYKGLHSDNDTVRINCIRLLGDLKDTMSLDTLIALLKSEKKKKVKRAIIAALGDIGVKRAATEIIPYLKDKDMRMRLVACVALGKLKNPESVGPLFDAMEDKSYLVRSTALWALEKIGNEKVLEGALKRLKKRFWENYVGQAVNTAGAGLEILGNPDIVGIAAIEAGRASLPGLTQKKFDELMCWKRIKYIRLIGRVAPSIYEKHPDDTLVILARERLIKLLNSPCYLARGYAVRALSKFNDDRIKRLLESKSLTETNLFVRSQYEETLQKQN